MGLFSLAITGGVVDVGRVLHKAGEEHLLSVCSVGSDLPLNSFFSDPAIVNRAFTSIGRRGLLKSLDASEEDIAHRMWDDH